MKKHYDFSNGEKAKFYTPEDEIELPIYLDKNNQSYYYKLAANKNIDLSQLINSILDQDKSLMNIILSE
jgi:hypothetical protein